MVLKHIETSMQQIWYLISVTEVNYRLRTGDDLPDSGEVIGIRHFCLLRGIGRVTGR